MEKEVLKRSSEFHAIIFKRPAWMIRWGMLMIWVLILLLFAAAACIKQDNGTSLLGALWNFIKI